ncbi:DNA repair protein RecO [bacterium]|nr:DNA repair protein RecO [bacterium]
MPLVKTEAIVLTARPLGDTSKIVTLLTPQRGVIRAVAKGARRPKGRLASGTVAYRVIEAIIYLKEGRELGHLSEAHVIWSAPRIGGNWRLFLIAGTLSETVLAVTEEGGYHLLRTSVELLEGGIEPRLVMLFFFKGLLKAQGLWPDFTSCVVCDGDLSGGAMLDTPDGRVLCGRHRREGYLPINAGGVRLLNEVERRSVLKGRHADRALESALKACLSLAEYHFDLRLRSDKLLAGAEHLLERTGRG